MITNVSIVNVFVTDQDAAKQFYTEVLGFEERGDVTLGEGFRWCTVGHPSQPELLVSLVIPGPPLDPDLIEAMKRGQSAGGLLGIGLNVDDCQKTFEELTAKGVEFPQPPSTRPYGVEAVCRDNSGNWLILLELAKEPGAQDGDVPTGGVPELHRTPATDPS
ncbi:MAG: glyoxalase [Pseudonocardiales bacterium]|nr:MAG: glyoxalase [Pseudonocardiales bacterium]